MNNMKKQTFREWFFKDYLMQTNISSPLLIGNKAISDRQERICQVAEYIIKNKNKSIENIREEIAMKFFITMRCSLDYLNYAGLFIEKWKNEIKKRNV